MSKPHKDSGCRCMVGHMKDGKSVPACIKCSECGGWIRPEDMGTGCGDKIDWINGGPVNRNTPVKAVVMVPRETVLVTERFKAGHVGYVPWRSVTR